MVDDAGAAVVEARETHLSRLFFTPERVYKLLKPVTTSFVSFADTEDRLAAARTEYECNRRFSPDVYLGTADVVEQGRVVDRMVVMRRLPETRQLHRLLAPIGPGGDGGNRLPAGLDLGRVDDWLRSTAKLVASMHADASPVTGPEAEPADADHLTALWRDNFDTLAPLVGSVIDGARFDRVRSRSQAFVAGRRTLLAERIDQGWIRAGHGDLRAEHVFCLDDGPRLIDALAFRDDFRIGDVLNDVAFLAMDLHRLAGAGAAARLMQYYCEFGNEHHPSTLAHFYVAYRAHVRAKVAAIRLGQGEVDAARDVAMYHRLADQHLEVGQVRLVLVGGGVGVGKSTVSEGLARRLGAIWLRTDEIRKTFDGGRDYSDAGRDRVYDRMIAQARRLLERGESVVLDATWSHESWRDRARRLAGELQATLTELECRVPQSVADRRVLTRGRPEESPPEPGPAGHDRGGEDRAGGGQDRAGGTRVDDAMSDATIDVAHHVAARFEPWPSAVGVDTSQSIDRSVDQACRAVTQPGSPRPRSHSGVTYESIRFFLRRSSTLPAVSVLVDREV